MKLEALAATPTLRKITIDDENIVKKYGETLDFYIYDRYDMELYLKLASMSGSGDDNVQNLFVLIKDLICDEKGNKIVSGNKILPTDIMVKVVEETLKNLGNTQGQILEK
jgi:hypothetical protein